MWHTTCKCVLVFHVSKKKKTKQTYSKFLPAYLTRATLLKYILTYLNLFYMWNPPYTYQYKGVYLLTNSKQVLTFSAFNLHFNITIPQQTKFDLKTNTKWKIQIQSTNNWLFTKLKH